MREVERRGYRVSELERESVDDRAELNWIELLGRRKSVNCGQEMY